MDISEVDLPGIGRKYALRDAAGDRFSVVIHHSGERELCVFEEGGDFPLSTVRLTDREARQLGVILAGADFQPVGEASTDAILHHLSFHWHTVEGAPLADQTIEALGIRRRTGATIIAVIPREGTPITNPPPGTVLREGDQLVVIGGKDQVEAFRKLAQGGGDTLGGATSAGATSGGPAAG